MDANLPRDYAERAAWQDIVAEWAELHGIHRKTPRPLYRARDDATAGLIEVVAELRLLGDRLSRRHHGRAGA